MASRWRAAENPRSGGGAVDLDKTPQRACPTADDLVAVREQEVLDVELSSLRKEARSPVFT
jgi:hypothetical protein